MTSDTGGTGLPRVQGVVEQSHSATRPPVSAVVAYYNPYRGCAQTDVDDEGVEREAWG